MIRYLQKLIVILFLLQLAACAAIPKISAPATTPLTWQQRYHALNKIDHWQIRGAIGIHYGTQNTIASLIWRQQQQSFNGLISGPLNFGAIRIAGGPGNVSLWKSGKVFTAASAEALMQAQLGWQLPVSNLYYWVRGIPNPYLPAKTQFDNAHRLIQIAQQSWLIQYQSFISINNIDLPGKIILTNSTLQVKLVIKQWQI